jgi:hypothetical protein
VKKLHLTLLSCGKVTLSCGKVTLTSGNPRQSWDTERLKIGKNLLKNALVKRAPEEQRNSIFKGWPIARKGIRKKKAKFKRSKNRERKETRPWNFKRAAVSFHLKNDYVCINQIYTKAFRFIT